MKKALVTLVVLAFVLLGADFAAGAYAEHRLAAETQDELELADRPDVTIHGFPFLPQAVRGHYEQVSIAATNVSMTEALQELELAAELAEVDAPLTDVLAGNTDAITIGELEGTVRVGQQDLGRLIRFPSLQIEPGNGGSGGGQVPGQPAEPQPADPQPAEPEDAEHEAGEGATDIGTSAAIRLIAATGIAGEDVEVVAGGVIELDDRLVQIQADTIEFGRAENSIQVPEAVLDTLLPEFEAEIDPDSLPFGVTPTGVGVEPGALLVRGQAQDVNLAML